MKRSHLLGFGVATSLVATLVLGFSSAGCQSSSSGGGGGESSSTGSSSGQTSSSGSSSSHSASGSTSSSGSTDAGPPAQVTTISDITTGKIGLGIAAQLKGVVAMSHKFLVSQSSSTGSCLWGVFVSAPGLTETAENTGLLAVSYGTSATTNDAGKAYCPVLGKDPAGDAFPDDVKPGDVLDLTGKTASYVPTSCGQNAGESKIPQFQLSNVKTATRSGTAPLPTPHLLADADVASLASPTDTAFHAKWGGVKVRIQNLTSVPQTGGDAGATVTDSYGHIVLATSNLQVGDKIYYQGYLKGGDVCYAGPSYANPTTTFTQIDGFSYLDYCTWSLEPESRCMDLTPPSDNCASVADAGADAGSKVVCTH